MKDNLKIFQRKVNDRKFGVEHSWKGQAYAEESPREAPISEDKRLWNALDENLRDANAVKFSDGYFPLHSNKRGIGRIIVFVKRAIRKLLKIFLGWYIFPIFQRQNHFNGKMVNAAALERELILHLENRVNELEQKNNWLNDELRKTGSQLLQTDSRNKEEIQRIIHQTAQADKQNKEEIQRIIHQAAQVDQQHKEVMRQLTGRMEETDKKNQEEFNALQTSLRKLENLPTSDDEFYHHFEERFRGSREEIVNRLSIYIPLVQEHIADWSQARFVDIGSGRGEWMDILKHYGAVDYVGVDLNARQNTIAEAHGHRTVCCDCIEYLASQPDDSVDMISGIQIIEHLCMSDLMELLKQSYRVLKKGGIILFETPNPRNISVAAYAFYNDPSHKRPLDPDLMSFITEWIGFKDVKCLDANSSEASASLELPEDGHENYRVTKAVNDIKWVLFGPMDYALFAVKE